MIKISDYISSELVIFPDCENRDEVLHQMVNVLQEKKYLKNKDEFYNAIIDREKIVTTGIGMGVAVPHAKLPDQNKFFIAIAILKNGVDWNALDDAPVRIVFMIGGPDDKQTEYLQILSSLTLSIKDDNRRKKLSNTNSAEDVVALFEGR